MDVTFKDTKTIDKLKAQIRREVITEIRQVCGDCPKLREFEQTEYKRMPRKVKGIYRNY